MFWISPPHGHNHENVIPIIYSSRRSPRFEKLFRVLFLFGNHVILHLRLLPIYSLRPKEIEEVQRTSCYHQFELWLGCQIFHGNIYHFIFYRTPLLEFWSGTKNHERFSKLHFYQVLNQRKKNFFVEIHSVMVLMLKWKFQIWQRLNYPYLKINIHTVPTTLKINSPSTWVTNLIGIMSDKEFGNDDLKHKKFLKTNNVPASARFRSKLAWRTQSVLPSKISPAGSRK